MHYKLFKSFGIFVDDWYNDLCFALITVKEQIVTCQLFDFYSNSFVATVLIFQYTYLAGEEVTCLVGFTLKFLYCLCKIIFFH